MAVHPDTVREMAKLARLTVAEDQLERVASQLGAIIDHMGTISQWDGDAACDGPGVHRRADVVSNPDGSGLQQAAAQHEQGHVIVPPIKGAS
ncbi:MAG: Asp-tRNA(Asn)/Glu-tRNA(Gln) amidotransferase subunit GatC [Myxococcota bacterium]